MGGFMGYGSFHILLSPVVFRVQNDDEFLGMVLISGGYALYSQIGVFLEDDLPASFRLDFSRYRFSSGENQRKS